MDELRLVGNAAAGTLGEVFSEVTTAEYPCGECGRTGRLGEAMVYEVRDLGTVVRCPGCPRPRASMGQWQTGMSYSGHSRPRIFFDWTGSLRRPPVALFTRLPIVVVSAVGPPLLHLR
jgi:hypothetical protein